MTMVSSGEISIGGSATSGGLNRSINIELGRAATATTSLNDAAVRTLAGAASGAISLSNFYGRSNTIVYNPISALSNTTYNAYGTGPYGTTTNIAYFNSDGTWSIPEAGASGNWGNGVTGSSYWIKFTLTSTSSGGAGTKGSSGTTGWLNLGTQRSTSSYATITSQYDSYITAIWTIQISTSSTGSPVISTTTGFGLYAYRDLGL